jgi:hypothetical protein
MQGEYKVTLTFENPLANFFADKSLSVPLSQVILYEVIVNLCMLLRRRKMGLFVSYAFFLFGINFKQTLYYRFAAQSKDKIIRLYKFWGW